LAPVPIPSQTSPLLPMSWLPPPPLRPNLSCLPRSPGHTCPINPGDVAACTLSRSPHASLQHRFSKIPHRWASISPKRPQGCPLFYMPVIKLSELTYCPPPPLPCDVSGDFPPGPGRAQCEDAASIIDRLGFSPLNGSSSTLQVPSHLTLPSAFAFLCGVVTPRPQNPLELPYALPFQMSQPPLILPTFLFLAVMRRLVF